MKSKIKLILIVIGFLSYLTVFSQTKSIKYYCTPCNAPCDAKSYEKPGTCDACNMPIIFLTDEELKLSLENSDIPKPLDLKYNEWEELGSSPYRASRLWINNYRRKHVQILN